MDRIHVRKARRDEHVRRLLCCDRRVVDPREETCVHAGGGLVAPGAGQGGGLIVHPASAQGVVPLVPVALWLVWILANLGKEAVPHAVELVAKGPEEQARVARVPRYLMPEAVDGRLAVLPRQHRRLRHLAHEVGRHHVQAMIAGRIQEGRVVVLGLPAVDAQHVGAHSLDERQVAQPHERVLRREVVTIRFKVHRFIDRRG